MTETKASTHKQCDSVASEGPLLTAASFSCAFLPILLWRGDITVLGEKLYKTESGREFEPSALGFLCFFPLLFFF